MKEHVKGLIYFSPGILAIAFIIIGNSCKHGQVTTKTTVTKVEIGSEKVCASGTFSITADTKALRDSLLAAAKNDVVQIKAISDSANTSIYQWDICSPKTK